jgi:hypothetical protein
MRVPAQQKIEPGVRGLPVDLRRMRQQDRECIQRDVGARLLQVVRAVEVRVIDARIRCGCGMLAQRVIASGHQFERNSVFQITAADRHNGCRKRCLIRQPLHVSPETATLGELQ